MLQSLIVQTAFVKTPLGICKIAGDENGVSSVSIHDSDDVPHSAENSVLQQAASEIIEYFEKRRTHFSFHIKPIGTDFQKRVWNELLNIPYGKTVSYSELSCKLGDIKAIRAVASANGKNPLWIVVPCHRVIGSDGSLTGYAGELWRKKWLLEHENPPLQTELF